MDFKILEKENLADNTLRISIEVRSSHLMYFGYFLEAHEGWCNYTTVRKNPSVIEIDFAPDFSNQGIELLEYLDSWDLK